MDTETSGQSATGPLTRAAALGDVARMAEIYNHYILATTVTFETCAIQPDEMSDRLCKTQALGFPWLVAETNGVVAGYAYGSEWKGRCAYQSTQEVSVYFDHRFLGQGLGTTLYRALAETLIANGAHTLIGGIALPNEASIRLHEKLGFTKVAHFVEVGNKFDRWIDVGYWQLMARDFRCS